MGRSVARIAILICIFVIGGIAPVRAQDANTRDVITTAVPDAWPPHFIFSAGEAPTGFAVDILEAVAANAGYRIEYRKVTSIREAFDMAVSGEVNLLASTGITPERLELLNFTDPVETFVVSIFVRADSLDISSVDDLTGHRVAVVKRNIGLRLVKRIQGAEPVVFDDEGSALFDLLAGRVDAMIYPQPILENLAAQIGVDAQIRTIGEPLVEIKRAIGIHKSQTEIHRRLSAAVAEFVGTPEYQKIYVKWFGRAEGFWTVTRVLTAGGTVLLFVVVAFSLWHYRAIVHLNRALEHRVEERTEELREAQSELLRKERLATLGQLTGTMAHELRNPLGSIVLAFELIKRRLADTDPDLKKNLERAERNIDRCTSIIDDLLEFAQYRPMALKPEDLDGLIRELASEYDLPDNVSFDLELALDGTAIEIDREKIRRILLNFLDNATQAISDRAERRDEPGTVTITTRPAGNMVELKISDNGPGIPPEHMPRIMEPLYSTKSFGVGLGLPNAQNIVAAHSGSLSIQSVPGAGTTVTVLLPPSAAPASQTARIAV